MIITIDFETYFSKDYSLTKITTEEYVRDDRFEVVGVGVKIDDEPTEWFSGTMEETKAWLDQFDWGNAAVLAHNTLFDGAIMSWQFNIKPMIWLDTLCMARAVDGVEVGNSLGKLAERYGLGVKGDDTRWSIGLRRADFTKEQMAAYAKYCINDVDLTYKLFNILREGFKKSELKLIDLTLRMFTEPSLELNLPLLEQHLIDVVDKKEALIKAAESDREILLSNQKFADKLREYGVEPPMKISNTTGKVALALAKSDEGFKALAEHPDLRVQALVAARLGTKSTLEETRTQRFIDIAKRGSLPVPLRYYAAHTGRWGGDDKLNLQNLPRKSPLKVAISAPEGYVLIDSDSSQIEARVLAWLAGQNDLVQAFDRGEDVYKIMAAKIYKKDAADITDDERFVGKTTILGCFGADTLVLTDSGWKRIVEVQGTDMLWDGEEWVKHQGVVPQGAKETIRGLGIDVTPEHEILTEHGWKEWSEVITNPSLTQSAINKGSLPSWIGRNILNQQDDLQGGIPLSDVHAGGKGKLTDTTSKPDELLGATHALKTRLTKLASTIGGMNLLSLTRSIAHGFSTAYRVVSHGVITLITKRMPIMGGGVFLYTSCGEKTEQNSYATLYRLQDGMTFSVTSTVSTTVKDTNQTIYGSQQDQKTQRTNALPELCKQKLMTYDIAYAGPRNRYTVATSAGPLIVHNCGYGMGYVKFQAQLKTFGVDLDTEFCAVILRTYREEFPWIPQLWMDAENCLEALSRTDLRTNRIGFQPQAVYLLPGIGFDFPSGIPLRYTNLHKEVTTNIMSNGKIRNRDQFVYDTRKGKVGIYGGKVVENICQALARCVIGEQMLRISKRYQPVLTVHDAVACLAPIEEADEAAAYVQECMRWRPKWAETLPLNCEVKVGDSYGGAKKWNKK